MIESFVEFEWNEKEIRNSVDTLLYFSSTNDEYIPMELAYSMQEQFGGEMIEVENAGHINERAGFTEVPFVLEKLKGLLDL